MAFIDLPFKSASLYTTAVGPDMILTSETNFLAVCNITNEFEAKKAEMDLILSQKFFDSNDLETEVKTFKTATKYTSKITVTNLSD